MPAEGRIRNTEGFPSECCRGGFPPIDAMTVGERMNLARRVLLPLDLLGCEGQTVNGALLY